VLTTFTRFSQNYLKIIDIIILYYIIYIIDTTALGLHVFLPLRIVGVVVFALCSFLNWPCGYYRGAANFRPVSFTVSA
jgi:hypothetical protein